jgi:uncharacterized protein
MAWQAQLIDGLANVFSGFLSKYVFDWKARRMITSSPFMSCREVLDLAEVVVDSLRFAGEGGCLSGKLELSSLARLHDLLTGRDGRLDCELSGDCIVDADGRRKSFLHLRVSGQLKMRCQRCLGDVDWQCAVVSHLLLVPENAAWPEGELEADAYDALPASRELSVLELVEDEVLLALPIAPCHEDCRLPAKAGGLDGDRGSSPFAALAGLKKQH